MARTAVSPSPASRRSTPRSNAGVPPARLMSPDEKIKYAAKRSAGDAGSAKQPPAAACTAFSIVGPADVAVLALGVGVWLYVMLSFGVPLLSPPPAVSFVAVAAGVAPSQLLLYPLVWYNSKALRKRARSASGSPFPSSLARRARQGAAASRSPRLDRLPLRRLRRRPLRPSPRREPAAVGGIRSTRDHGAGAQRQRVQGHRRGRRLLRLQAWRPGAVVDRLPFSAGFRHPQYVGGYCSQLGVFALFASKATIAAGLVPLAGWWAALYVLNSVIEASDDNDAA